MSKHQTEKFKGIVQSYNISPKGMFEGLIMQSGEKLIQVNFEPEAGAYISAHFPEGKTISLKASMHHDEKKGVATHPVYHLESFDDAKQKTVKLHAGEKISAAGKVKRLNYSLHGQINGAVLDNGDFVHVKPHGAQKIGIEVGQEISVEGEVRPSFVSHRVIEAETVNGVSLRDKAAA